MPLLSRALVVLPTYNERESIESVLRGLLSHPHLDALVIDDNSPDGTAEVASALALRLPGRVHVLRRHAKEGLGSAYRDGFVAALALDYERFVQMDADGSHAPDAVPRLVAALDDADLVLGSRYCEGGQSPGWSLWRRGISRLAGELAGIALHLPQADLTSGFKAWRRQTLEAIEPATLRSRGFAIQIETTYRAHRAGFSIVELPVEFRPRASGESKFTFGICAEAAYQVGRLRLQRWQPSRSAAPTGRLPATGR
ncbi:MAG TPA: polyprenol monophosphomannose synthase [Dehalococcoidia bacterium]|nr:polyprenol monophosphomannose synthase [Dehalococcoidia bacterium]